MRPDPETIRSLVAFLEQEGLEELSYEADGVSVRVRKEPSPVLSPPAVQVVRQVKPVPPPEPKPVAPLPAGTERATRGQDLLSPMAGIFYRSSSPGAEPFVKVGDLIDTGQTVGLVEAMKTFNEVAAESAGRVIDFYVQDGHSVQKGQPILAVEPLEGEI